MIDKSMSRPRYVIVTQERVLRGPLQDAWRHDGYWIVKILDDEIGSVTWNQRDEPGTLRREKSRTS